MNDREKDIHVCSLLLFNSYFLLWSTSSKPWHVTSAISTELCLDSIVLLRSRVILHPGFRFVATWAARKRPGSESGTRGITRIIVIFLRICGKGNRKYRASFSRIPFDICKTYYSTLLSRLSHVSHRAASPRSLLDRLPYFFRTLPWFNCIPENLETDRYVITDICLFLCEM